MILKKGYNKLEGANHLKNESFWLKNIIVGHSNNKSILLFKIKITKKTANDSTQRAYTIEKLVSNTNTPINFMCTELEFPVFAAHLVLWFNKFTQLFTGKVVTTAVLDFK